MSSFINILKKTVSAILLLFFVFSPFTTQAQYVPNDQISPNQAGTQQNVMVDMPVNSGQSQAKSLEELRKEAEKACKAEQQGGFGNLGGMSGLAGGMQKITDSLQNVVSQGLKQTLPQTLSSVFTDKLPQLIQDQLQNKLPQFIETSLSQQLPQLVGGRMQNMAAGGASGVDIQNALPQMFQEAIQTLLPQIMQRGIATITGVGLTNELPAVLAGAFETQMPNILAGSHFPQEISTLVASTTEIQVSLPGIIPGVPGGTINLNGLIPDADRATMNTRVLQGIADTVSQGIAASSALNNIAAQLAPYLVSKLLPGISGQMLGGQSGLTGLFGGGGVFGGGFNNMVNGGSSGWNLSGSNNILNDVAGIDLTPLSHDLAGPLGQWAAGGIRDLQVDSLIRNTGLSNITQADVLAIPGATTNDVVASALGGSVDQLGADGVSGVSEAADKIGDDAVKGMDWGAIGNGLKGSVASGFGSGIGGLVDQIPYVGGLISPIVEQMVTDMMNQLLGVTEVAINVPVTDQGVQRALGQINKTASKIESESKQSNKNEDRAYKLQQEEQDINLKACTYLKMITAELKTTNDYYYKYRPDSLKSGAAAISASQDSLNKTNAIGRLVSETASGIKGGNQESLFVKDYRLYLSETKKDAVAKAVDDVKASKNSIIGADAITKTIIKEGADAKHPASRSAEWTPAREKKFLEGKSENLLADLVEYNRYDKGNNIFTASMLTHQAVTQQINDDQDDALRKVVDGSVPLEICVEFTADGRTCKRKQAVSSIAELQAMRNAYNDFWVEIALSETFNTDLFNAQTNIINQRLGGEEAKSIMQGQDPCPEVGVPCANAGWNARAAKPDLTNYPGSQLARRTQTQSTWRTDFDKALTDGLTDLMENKFDDFLDEGEDTFDRFTDLNQLTSEFRGGESKFEVQNIIIPRFANRFIDDNRDYFPRLTDANRPTLVQILVDLLIELLDKTLNQNG